jgi:hypothetical protein
MAKCRNFDSECIADTYCKNYCRLLKEENTEKSRAKVTLGYTNGDELSFMKSLTREEVEYYKSLSDIDGNIFMSSISTYNPVMYK